MFIPQNLRLWPYFAKKSLRFRLNRNCVKGWNWFSKISLILCSYFSKLLFYFRRKYNWELLISRVIVTLSRLIGSWSLRLLGEFIVYDPPFNFLKNERSYIFLLYISYGFAYYRYDRRFRENCEGRKGWNSFQNWFYMNTKFKCLSKVEVNYNLYLLMPWNRKFSEW